MEVEKKFYNCRQVNQGIEQTKNFTIRFTHHFNLKETIQIIIPEGETKIEILDIVVVLITTQKGHRSIQSFVSKIKTTEDEADNKIELRIMS